MTKRSRQSLSLMLVAASSEDEEEAVVDETELPPPVNLDLYPPTPPPPLFLVGIGREIAQNGSNVTDSWPQSSHRSVDLRG